MNALRPTLDRTRPLPPNYLRCFIVPVAFYLSTVDVFPQGWNHDRRDSQIVECEPGGPVSPVTWHGIWGLGRFN